MKRVSLVVAVVVLLGGLPFLNGHAEDKNTVQALMKKKLENSQKVLEGLATNDFGAISKHAQDLIRISKSTDWKVIKTPQYELFSNEFRRNADSLVQNAKAKNLDGASLAYVEMTLTCVRCHKYVREVRMARLD